MHRLLNTDERRKKLKDADNFYDLEETDRSRLWHDPIVTEITKFDKFYVAEDYHKNYYKNNANKGYCSAVIAPKVRKLYKEFNHLLKDEVKQ